MDVSMNTLCPRIDAQTEAPLGSLESPSTKPFRRHADMPQASNQATPLGRQVMQVLCSSGAGRSRFTKTPTPASEGRLMEIGLRVRGSPMLLEDPIARTRQLLNALIARGVGFERRPLFRALPTERKLYRGAKDR